TLGSLPPDAMAYVCMDLESRTFQRLQGMSLNLLNSSGKSTPALDKAMAELHGLGRIRSIGSATIAGGISGLTDITVSDPKKYLEASLAMLQAMKGGEGQANVYKDLKIERDVRHHAGLTFTHVVATMDLEKLAQIGGNNPGQATGVKAVLGGETLS